VVAISWWTQVEEMMMMMYTLSWILIVLDHWNNSLQVDMSLHSDTLFWFRENQYTTIYCITHYTQLSIVLHTMHNYLLYYTLYTTIYCITHYTQLSIVLHTILLKELKFICNFLWQSKKKVTYQCRWLLKRGDRMGRFTL
jgi:hypothetical protein